MYTVADISRMTGYHKETIKKWIHEGKLRAEGGGRGKPYKINQEDYKKFVENRSGLTRSLFDAEPIRGELLMELIEISKMERVLDRRRSTIINTLKRLE